MGSTLGRVAMEVQQLAERLAQQDLLVDRDGLAVDLGRRQAEGGLAVVARQPRDDLGARRHRLAEPGVGQRVVGAGGGLLEGVGPKPDRLGELTLELVRVIQHIGMNIQAHTAWNRSTTGVTIAAMPHRERIGAAVRVPGVIGAHTRRRADALHLGIVPLPRRRCLVDRFTPTHCESRVSTQVSRSRPLLKEVAGQRRRSPRPWPRG